MHPAGPASYWMPLGSGRGQEGSETKWKQEEEEEEEVMLGEHVGSLQLLPRAGSCGTCPTAPPSQQPRI